MDKTGEITPKKIFLALDTVQGRLGGVTTTSVRCAFAFRFVSFRFAPRFSHLPVTRRVIHTTLQSRTDPSLIFC